MRKLFFVVVVLLTSLAIAGEGIIDTKELPKKLLDMDVEITVIKGHGSSWKSVRVSFPQGKVESAIKAVSKWPGGSIWTIVVKKDNGRRIARTMPAVIRVASTWKKRGVVYHIDEVEY